MTILKFKHDCDNCKFIGNFLGYDVYTCGEGENTSIVSRCVDTPGNYESQRLSHFHKQITDNHIMEISTLSGDTYHLTFQEYLFSNDACPYHQAWILALACRS